MKVGIIGSGVVDNVGLGVHETGPRGKIGTREPAKLKDWARRIPASKLVVSWRDGIRRGRRAGGRGRRRAQGAEAEGMSRYRGETVIDACNPIGGRPPLAYWRSSRLRTNR